MKNIFIYISQSIIGMTLLGILYLLLFTNTKKVLGDIGQGLMNIIFYK